MHFIPILLLKQQNMRGLEIHLQCLYITVKKLAIKFTFSWFPVVVIRVAEVLIINTAFSAFARRGANCCHGRDHRPFGRVREVNLQFMGPSKPVVAVWVPGGPVNGN
jgi:hypothetical protein